MNRNHTFPFAIPFAILFALGILTLFIGLAVAPRSKAQNVAHARAAEPAQRVQTTTSATSAADPHDLENAMPHVVFVTGDEEYRSEESMPMLAAILRERFGFRVTVCYSLADDGTIDPNNTLSITGLEALADADLMVMFTRFRALPDDQLAMIMDYVASGKPMAGFRTATHAFRYPDDHPHAERFNNAWPRAVFGSGWVSHHGHHGDNHSRLTAVAPVWREGDAAHPVTRGVSHFQASSWLYHVHGGEGHRPLSGDSTPLVRGWSLRSNHEREGRLDRFPLEQPVAWVKTFSESDEAGDGARVFFTTLGHPYDFQEVDMRRLAIQGLLWAIGAEAQIPEGGLSDELLVPIYPYEPNPSGFGDKFKVGLTPEMLLPAE